MMEFIHRVDLETFPIRKYVKQISFVLWLPPIISPQKKPVSQLNQKALKRLLSPKAILEFNSCFNSPTHTSFNQFLELVHRVDLENFPIKKYVKSINFVLWLPLIISPQKKPVSNKFFKNLVHSYSQPQI